MPLHVLGVLFVDDDGMRKDGASATLGKSYGLMSPQNTNVSLS